MDSKAAEKKLEARRCSEVMRDLVYALRGRFEEGLRGTGVTLAQLRLLKAVEQQSDASAASIARQCQVTPQTLHTMLSRAAREGWIVRGSSEQNHRFVTAALTPEGSAILERGGKLREELEDELWQGTSLERLREVREALEGGLGNLRRAEVSMQKTPPHPNR